MTIKAAFVATITLLGSAIHAQTRPAYQDPTQPIEARVEDALSKLGPDEKIYMISGVDGYDAPGVKRLGIPKMHMSDGPCGPRNDGPTTAYPAPVLLAASWDVDLARHFGDSVGRDCRARGVHYWLGPAMNICREPQCGRNFEYLGEDPYLAGQIAVRIIQGVQSRGVSATAKHFAANNQEFERQTISAQVDERTLQEIYFPAFKASVQQGHVWAVMCAYNKLNGTYCSANRWLLDDILKKSWGFTGVCMSDWGAVHDTLGPIDAGLDIEMPSGKNLNKDEVQPLLDSGKVQWSTIDDKCRRLLRVATTMGAFDRPQKDVSIPWDDPRSDATALQIAREGIVLLKNENHTLPLDRNRIKTIAIVGPNADPAVTGGGGSSYTKPDHAISVLAGICEKASENTKIVRIPSSLDQLLVDFVKSSDFGDGLAAEFFDNRDLTGDPVIQRTDRTIDFNWERNPPKPLKPEDYSARWTGKIKVPADGRYLFFVESDDGSRVFLDGKQIISIWSNHQAMKRFVTQDLTKGEHDLQLEYYQAGNKASLRFGWGKPMQVLDDAGKRQIAEADAAIVCCGFNGDSESEGGDRTFNLPYPQDDLINAVAQANPHTVLILNAGGNVDMQPWIDHVPALLHAWYPGQAGGTAIAEVLFGDVNPSGRLPQSFEKHIEDNAAVGKGNYPGKDGQVKYDEGIFVGYRHFDHDNIEPRFPFGFGLSYTTFDLKNLKVSPAEGRVSATREVSVDVTNTGDRAGADVVQLYVGQLQCTVERPVRELKQFARVELKPRETKTVKMSLDRDAFSYYSVSAKEWVVDPGDFQIAVGQSSRDFPLKQMIDVK